MRKMYQFYLVLVIVIAMALSAMAQNPMAPDVNIMIQPRPLNMSFGIVIPYNAVNANHNNNALSSSTQSTEAGLVYGLGVSLGIARYMASIKSKSMANYIKTVNDHVSALKQRGINLSSVTSYDHNYLVDVSNNFLKIVTDTTADYSSVFSFGLSIGISEGQAHGGSQAALEFAKKGLMEAQVHAKNLSKYGITPEMVPVVDYQKILYFRKECQNKFNHSSSGPPSYYSFHFCLEESYSHESSTTFKNNYTINFPTNDKAAAYQKAQEALKKKHAEMGDNAPKWSQLYSEPCGELQKQTGAKVNSVILRKPKPTIIKPPRRNRR